METENGCRDLALEIDRRYEYAYRGAIDLRDTFTEAWTSKYTAPYAMHIVETSVTALMEDRLRFRVKPRPKFYNADEWKLAREGAQANQWLLAWELEQCRYHEKQRALILQDRIAGATCVKTMWRKDVRTRPTLALRSREILDDSGFPLGEFPMLTEVGEPAVVYDGPEVEVVDLRDFFYDLSASSWDANEICVHRVWMTPEDLWQMARSELPTDVRWRNLDELNLTRDFSGTLRARSLMDERERGKGRIEVLEIWLKEKGKIRVYTVANRTVLLNERDSPYWHGEMPFVWISTQQDMFQLSGISQIEKVEDLQRALWKISNLRIDATVLATMPIVLLNEAMDDPLSFSFSPMARNLVSSPQDVQLWSPSAQATQVSLPTENQLKSDMQNLAGGFPFTTTSESNAINAGSATEASLVNNLAQRALVTAKTFLNYGHERVGKQMMWLNQQLIREPVYIDVLGVNDEYEMKEILPEMLRGEYDFVMESSSESVNRQERRSEAISLFQTLVQAMSMFAMAGVPINPKPVLEELLDAFDRQDLTKYILEPQQQQGVPPGMPGLPGQALMGQDGATNPALAAGNTSPSNRQSMSPQQFQNALMAASTGPRNA
jgi:hypothetical protein